MALAALGLSQQLMQQHGVANILNAPYVTTSANVTVNSSRCFYIQAQKWVSCVYTFDINTSDALAFTINLALPIQPTYTPTTINELVGVSMATNGSSTSSLVNILRLNSSTAQVSIPSTFSGQQNIVSYLIYSYQ